MPRLFFSLRAVGIIQVQHLPSLTLVGLVHDEVVTFAVDVSPDDAELSVTLVWDDVPGVPNVVPALVNDLDLRVFDPNGGLHFPWTLDPRDPVAAAERNAPDRINNVEQVVVDAPQPGTWRVEVAGYRIPLSEQAFAICFSHALTVDCDGDGTPDDEQIADAPALDCGNNGILDVCESDCDGDGVVDTCALAEGDSRDCDRNGIPDDCEPLNDCNGNGVHDACDIADLFSGDCDENQVPDECDIDCNTNTIPDACELSGGSADCDDNGQFDLCEPWFDCNDNFFSDTCEVASGLVDDFNDQGRLGQKLRRYDTS